MKSACLAMGAVQLACARALDERMKAGVQPDATDAARLTDAWDACKRRLVEKGLRAWTRLPGWKARSTHDGDTQSPHPGRGRRPLTRMMATEALREAALPPSGGRRRRAGAGPPSGIAPGSGPPRRDDAGLTGFEVCRRVRATPAGELVPSSCSPGWTTANRWSRPSTRAPPTQADQLDAAFPHPPRAALGPTAGRAGFAQQGEPLQRPAHRPPGKLGNGSCPPTGAALGPVLPAVRPAGDTLARVWIRSWPTSMAPTGRWSAPPSPVPARALVTSSPIGSCGPTAACAPSSKPPSARATPDDPQALLMEGSVQDITEQVEAQRRIRQLAYFDPLTGLPNREFFRESLLRRRRPLPAQRQPLRGDGGGYRPLCTDQRQPGPEQGRPGAAGDRPSPA